MITGEISSCYKLAACLSSLLTLCRNIWVVIRQFPCLSTRLHPSDDAPVDRKHGILRFLRVPHPILRKLQNLAIRLVITYDALHPDCHADSGILVGEGQR